MFRAPLELLWSILKPNGICPPASCDTPMVWRFRAPLVLLVLFLAAHLRAAPIFWSASINSGELRFKYLHGLFTFFGSVWSGDSVFEDVGSTLLVFVTAIP